MTLFVVESLRHLTLLKCRFFPHSREVAPARAADITHEASGTLLNSRMSRGELEAQLLHKSFLLLRNLFSLKEVS